MSRIKKLLFLNEKTVHFQKMGWGEVRAREKRQVGRGDFFRNDFRRREECRRLENDKNKKEKGQPK